MERLASCVGLFLGPVSTGGVTAEGHRQSPPPVADADREPVPPGDGDLYVSPSRFGLGLFAARSYTKGDTILLFSGALLTLEQVIAKGESQANPLQVDDRLYLDIGYPGVYANHSCQPNAGIRDDFWLVAMKPILAGQEIFWDYSTSMWEDYWVMSCQCGEPCCRHLIGDFPSLPAWQQRQYLRRGVVQAFIRRRLHAGKGSGSG
jgi:hypothetical protein